ncbi:MAG: cytochrome c peroxidase [Sulfuricurvum sp.]
MRFLLFLAPLLLNAVEPITPIPQKIPYSYEKASLGKSLFFDTILSRDQTISCASCHDFNHGGADPRLISIGINGKKGNMQSPSVFNAVFNFKQFWNGRAKNLTDQVVGPIHNPVEMGMTTAQIEKRINTNATYRDSFYKITGRSSITITDIAVVISEYEKTLITPNSKFDRFLRGEVILSTEELRGYTLFKTLGCASCHNGVNIGGNSFQKFGVIIPITRTLKTDDRYTLTKREKDKNVFKVPSLRNIALTAPYFHDGSAETLQGALKIMAMHNLGTKLSAKEIQDVISFLNTLTGQIPSKTIIK